MYMNNDTRRPQRRGIVSSVGHDTCTMIIVHDSTCKCLGHTYMYLGHTQICFWDTQICFRDTHKCFRDTYMFPGQTYMFPGQTYMFPGHAITRASEVRFTL